MREKIKIDRLVNFLMNYLKTPIFLNNNNKEE